MDATRFAALTNEQRHCLRLVAQGYSSKEIARPLGLHHRSIDARLDRARRIIGEPDRAAAARAFALHENETGTYDGVTYDPPAVAGMAHTSESMDMTWGVGPAPVPAFVREASASAPSDFYIRPHDAPEQGGARHGRSPLVSLTLIIAIAFGLVLVIAAAPALFDSFERVASLIDKPHLVPGPKRSR